MKRYLESQKWRVLAFILCLAFGLLTVAGVACSLYVYYEPGFGADAELNFAGSELFQRYCMGMQGERAFANYVRLYEFLFLGRTQFFPVTAALCTVTLLLFWFLLASAGRTPEGVQLRGVDRWPLELYTLLLLTLAGISTAVLTEVIDSGRIVESLSFFMPLLTFSVLGLGASALLWCMTVAARIRAGKWWRNTLTFHVLRFFWHLCRRLGRLLWTLLISLPVTWKLGAVFFLVCFLNWLLTVFIFVGENFAWFLILLFLDAVGLAIVLLLGLQGKKLLDAGRALASGDLGYTVDTRRLWLDLRTHGEDLNAVGQGMSRAVEERLRSERFKTELITNVSHDLKTPLTSIVNYVDLLQKENIENEQAREYIAVLARQAERLRKLTLDLVDASKASSGALTVSMETLDLKEMLTQVNGEYAERLAAAGVETVADLPEEKLPVRADGRLLWRVLDNLFLNVTKYAQPGTRFYVNLNKTDDGAEIILKNISRQALNIPAEELLERFVRGDSARSTEGSGLGLSIARSLMELMGGALELSLDGDLFKVTLKFKA